MASEYSDAKRHLQKKAEFIRGILKKKVICILDEAHLLEKETTEIPRWIKRICENADVCQPAGETLDR